MTDQKMILNLIIAISALCFLTAYVAVKVPYRDRPFIVLFIPSFVIGWLIADLFKILL